MPRWFGRRSACRHSRRHGPVGAGIQPLVVALVLTAVTSPDAAEHQVDFWILLALVPLIVLLGIAVLWGRWRSGRDKRRRNHGGWASVKEDEGEERHRHYGGARLTRAQRTHVGTSIARRLRYVRDANHPAHHDHSRSGDPSTGS